MGYLHRSTIHYLAQIHIEFNALQKLCGECKNLGIQRPLFITDRGLEQQASWLKLTQMQDLRYFIFDQSPLNSTKLSVRQVAKIYTENECVGLIAIGKGSPIDCAKEVAILA